MINVQKEKNRAIPLIELFALKIYQCNWHIIFTHQNKFSLSPRPLSACCMRLPINIVYYLQEVDKWCKKLHGFPLSSLVEPFKLITDWHKEGDHIYMFSKEGKQIYRKFANDMAELMNKQWQSGETSQGNLSKDKRTMIR